VPRRDDGLADGRASGDAGDHVRGGLAGFLIGGVSGSLPDQPVCGQADDKGVIDGDVRKLNLIGLSACGKWQREEEQQDQRRLQRAFRHHQSLRGSDRKRRARRGWLTVRDLAAVGPAALPIVYRYCIRHYEARLLEYHRVACWMSLTGEEAV